MDVCVLHGRSPPLYTPMASFITDTVKRYEFLIDHRSCTHNLRSCEIKGWKNLGLKGIRIYDLSDTGAVLCQLSYQAIRSHCEFVIFVEGEEHKWIYERSYIWTAEKDRNLWLIITDTVIHTTEAVVKLKRVQIYDHLQSVRRSSCRKGDLVPTLATLRYEVTARTVHVCCGE